MTSKDNHSLPYDLAAAAAYIETLSPEPLPLSISSIADAPLQPTIGGLAATLIRVLIAAHQPRRILEIGTSLGYSAIALGRAASAYSGQVVSLEINERLAETARQNIAAAELGATVTVVTADARAWLRQAHGAFGFVLQDGGKEDYLPMLDSLVELLEPNGLLISDDVLFPVMELPTRVEHWKQAIAEYNRELASHPRLRTVWLPIGDGVAISAKLD